jgi:uncharacterized protein (UPF0276 family)
MGGLGDRRVGVGLRSPHYAEISRGDVGLPFVEAISENFLGLLGGAGGGRPLEVLMTVREQMPVFLHGVSLNLGSADDLDGAYLARLRELVDAVEPDIVSDHLCWTGFGGENLHDLLPLPYTEEALRHLSGRIAAVQDRLGRQLLVENISSYVAYTHSGLSEWEFLAELVKRTGCGVLLDVNNVFVSATNLGFDPHEFLAGLPVDAVGQMHLGGHSRQGRLLIDTHDHPVCPEVWALYGEAQRRFGGVPTILERDDHIPPLKELMQEVEMADTVRRQLREPSDVVTRPTAASRRDPASAGPKPTLESVERWVRWLATDPRGIDAALEDHPGPRRAEEPEPRLLDTLVGDDLGTSRERLGVYSNAYFERLHETLTQDFPAVRHVVGEVAFRQLAADYLLVHPSNAPSLALLGSELPAFLHSSSWTDRFPFLPDLAALEAAVLRSLLSDLAAGLRLVQTSSQPAAVTLSGTLSLLDCRYAVVSLWRGRHRPSPPGSPPATRRQRLAVFRTTGGVGIQRLSLGEWSLLTELRAGRTLEAACCQLEALERVPTPAVVCRWFERWMTAGMIVGLPAVSRRHPRKTKPHEPLEALQVSIP